MRLYGPLTAAFFLTLAVGCARPDKVAISRSPTEGVFLTVETFEGHGPVSSEVTRVYAHFERHGKAKKILVLEGDNLTVSKILWVAPNADTLCLDGGITDIFRNQVTLILGDSREDAETIYSHLDEHCP